MEYGKKWYGLMEVLVQYLFSGTGQNRINVRFDVPTA
jgi:hypothetical protein